MAPSADAGGASGVAAGASAAPDLLVFVNGVRHRLPPGRAEATLLQYLRGASRSALRPPPLPLPAAMTLVSDMRRLPPRHAPHARYFAL
jgi:hypothetical protein